MKLQSRAILIVVFLALGACNQGVHANPSVEPKLVQQNASLQTNATDQRAISGSGVSIQANVDYGAQLMLVDRQGRQTGFDQATGRMLQDIPNSVYTEDSISDIADDSDNPAQAEVRLLHVRASPGDGYVLHVLPTDRDTYHLEFRCRNAGTHPVHVVGTDIGIAPGEQHLFSLNSEAKCSDRFVTGAFANRSGRNGPLLTYAFPTSANIHLSKTKILRIVILYDPDISASSFVATLNGQVVTRLFHPKPTSVESVSLTAKTGQNVLQLNVSSARDGSTPPADIFTINVD